MIKGTILQEVNNPKHLNKNVPHRLQGFEPLAAVDGSVYRGLGGMAWLEEVHLWKRAFRAHNLAPFPVSLTLLPVCA